MQKVEPVAYSFHVVKALALPCMPETSNNESPTKDDYK